MNAAGADGAATFRKYEHSGAYHHALMDHDPFYVAKIRKALSVIRRDAVALDVGCGDGVFVKYAREGGARVVGIDTSEEGVKLARAMSGSGDLCVGSAHLLPVRTSSIDVVVMIDLVNYLPDCERAICEATRTLKQNGILVVMSPYDVSLVAERAVIDDSWQTHAWTTEALRTLVEKYLHVDEVAFIEKVVAPPGLVALSRWLRIAGLWGLVRRLALVLLAFRARGGGSRSTASLAPEGGDIVLNPSSLPRSLVRGREKLEFIIVARREDASACP
mgnify:CR=1 FL=1|jgi:SAM-dependent methyltransferase